MTKIKLKVKAILTKIRYFSTGAVLSKNVVIEKNVQLSKGVSIGGYSYIGPNCNIRGDITVGAFFLCADGVCFAGNDHVFLEVGKPIIHCDVPKEKPTIIGDDVWIGHNVTIMRGIDIGDCSIIAAGSVVTKNIPEFSIVAGVPARAIKQRFNNNYDREEHLEKIRSYEKIINSI